MASGNLPEDVVTEILLMLPVKSLLRCKSVCKSWYTLIMKPSFTNSHLNCNAALKKNHCILIKRFLKESNKSVLSFIGDKNSGDDQVPPTEITIPHSNHFLQMLGACNGIVCLTDHNDIILCNPSIRDFKVLPAPSFNYPQGLFSMTLSVGFGFAPHSSEYKVIRIADLHEEDDDGASYVFHSVIAEIYDLSTDSWRGIDPVVPYICYFPCSQLLFNGAFHWWAYDHGDEWILSFHISTEVFQEIQLPDVCAFPDGNERAFLVLNESIALILFDSSEQTSFDIWLMIEYGVAESWTKYITIGPLVHVERPVLFWKYKLLLEKANGQLVSYDLKSQRLKEFQLYGAQESFRALVYSESLVPIKLVEPTSVCFPFESLETFGNQPSPVEEPSEIAYIYRKFVC
ncbi:hypothetical protein RJ639_007071 [Escallonia herrerae]|uniref:F-box domain-containing protein n=1 Tax=Escallonia herrerae TaxID=1293975 RepID=A0AA88VNF2_9ASTE|nr:hypothetical protein RJ639_010566 [Escallonia herrerae]KAK3015958.1 hypothetical protein RJ639_007071 [Escallonia herrerae]